MANTATLNKQHPKFEYLRKRMSDVVLIAAEKAAAHLVDPQQYPLPPAANKSLERAIYDVAMALPERKRDDFADKLKSAVNMGETQRRQKYGELAVVDLHSNKSVAAQVKDLPADEKMQITPTDMEAITGQKNSPAKKLNIKSGASRAKPHQAALATKLDFILDSLFCVHTNDIHKDEINVGAFATDNTGASFDKAPFFVGKFKKGESVALGAKGNLFSFSVDSGSVGIEFPAIFIGGLFIVEADLIHNEKLGEKLAALFSLIGLTLFTAGCVLLFVAGDAGPILFLIGAIAGLVFGVLGHYVIPLMIDDFSLAAVDTLVLDAQPGIGDTVNRSLTLDIKSSLVPDVTKGLYTANIRWVAG